MILHVNKNQFFIDTLLFVLSCFLVILLNNNETNLPYLGCILVIYGFYMLYKVRKNRLLTYLILIVSMVNISIGVNDMIQMGEGISEWQSTMLRASEYNMIAAKSIIIFISILNLFISGDVCKEQNNTDDIHNLRINNSLIAGGILAVLIIILGYAILYEVPKHLLSSYASVESPIFEYSIELYILAWLCTRDYKILSKFLIAYALAFSVVFLIIGDRSSASLYLIFLLVTEYKGKITYGWLLAISMGAIIFFNTIAIFRHNGIIPMHEFIQQLLDRGLYQDTASWAYYGSLAIVGVANVFPSRVTLFKSFLLSLIGVNNEYSSMTLFAKSYSSEFTNNGGGIFPTYFMAWLLIPGVIVMAILVGTIIRKFFTRSNSMKLFYELLLIVFGIRWYVYTPINLFRSVFFIGGLLYFAYMTANKLTIRRKNNL